MIEITNVKTFNFEGAIRGMRNPLNSWDKSDSGYQQIIIDGHFDGVEFIIGPNDLSLMKKLIKSGSDHRKFMRQIFVGMDINAPLYWWKEFDTYKVGTTANSCSTMHTIHKKEFVLDDFSHEKLGESVPVGNIELNIAWECLVQTIRVLNTARQWYLDTNDKKYWHIMIQLLPTSYNQKRTVTLTYENLINMYHARKNRKWDEWHTFCECVESMPYAKELICDVGV